MNPVPALRGRTAFRRPLPPAPLEIYELQHPAVPRHLDGLSILHIADLHIRRPPRRDHPVRRLIAALPQWPVDLALFTGDYMDAPGDEPAALAILDQLSRACRARLGVFGVFGNHDSVAFQRMASRLQGIHWLINTSAILEQPRIRLVGGSFPEDIPSALGDLQNRTTPELSLGLFHYPTEVFAAAELNVPICFAGHTHGGQVRLSATAAPHTSSDLPPHLASGVVRVRQTVCCISRGLGEGVFEVRWNCPPQAPLYRLRHGPLPAAERSAVLSRVRAW